MNQMVGTLFPKAQFPEALGILSEMSECIVMN